MRITSFEVEGLLGRPDILRGRMNEDLNILTGKNGAGKTSLMKLLWYVMSGNLILALREVSFRRLTLVTSEYEVTVYKLGNATCRVEMIVGDQTLEFEDQHDDDNDVIINAEDEANPELMGRGTSVFFPTFRRIEGGFSIQDRARQNPFTSSLFTQQSRKQSDIEEALSSLSRKLTNHKHIFVSSISTADIVGLLVTRYADLSAEYSGLQQKTSESVVAKIKDYQGAGVLATNANDLLDEVAKQIEFSEQRREYIMAPFNAVRALVEKLFRHYGINFGPRLSFGDAANAVNSDALSAGEKQMLSFICYNAFYSDAVFFIDEPELSLHVDWQRQIFGILQNQQSSNQFVIATHSPFIYGKYPDKELSVDLDRGDREL